LWTQSTAIWGSGIGANAAKAAFVIAFLLFYSWFSERRKQGPSTEWLRSQYELQIRNAAVQEERNRLARDLHDSIKQQLFVVQTSAAAVQTRLHRDPEGAQRALEDVRDAGRQASTEMRAMLEQLRAAPLELSGLVEALKQQCEAAGFRTGARVEFVLGTLPDSKSLQPGSPEAVLRVAQEALANVCRHARARTVRMKLDTTRGSLELRVSDDGAGFDTSQGSAGMGLANIRERARQFRGAWELLSSPGGGTTVVFSVPVSRATDPSELRTQAITAAALFVFGLVVLTQTRSVGVAVITLLAAFQAVQLLKALRTTGREAATR
jgi:signal transduction histidine kinase